MRCSTLRHDIEVTTFMVLSDWAKRRALVSSSRILEPHVDRVNQADFAGSSVYRQRCSDRGQRAYKRLINVWFTPAAMARHESATRALVSGLIDDFVGAGHCEFMDAFARPFPGRSFFELILGAPPDEAAHVTQIVMTATDPAHMGSKQAWADLIVWISTFIDRRRQQPRRHDVVDAVLHGDIEGRPTSEEEVLGILQLLLLGGLDTTAGALGAAMIRLCEDPQLFALLQRTPHRIPEAVEEFLRLDAPFIAIGRTAMADVEVSGQRIKAGDKVLIYWTAANRDPAEFADPDRFELDRSRATSVMFPLERDRIPVRG